MFDSREVENRKRIQAENRIAVNKYRDEFPTLTDEQLDAWMEQKKNNLRVDAEKDYAGVDLEDTNRKPPRVEHFRSMPNSAQKQILSKALDNLRDW